MNSIIKLNDKEYRKSGHTACNSSTLVKTMGSRGASHAGCIYPSQPVEVFDVSGAGDTFLAGLTTEYVKTGDILLCRSQKLKKY